MRAYGTLSTCSLSEVRNIDTDAYDVKLFIVRHPGGVMKSLSKKGFLHVPDLAPSEKLLENAKKDREISPNWKKTLEEGYIHEMGEKAYLIDRLEEHLQNGKNILLCCYCKKESDCHRGILKLILEIRHILNNKNEEENENESKT